MDELIRQIVKDGSPLVILFGIVWLFLSTMKSEREKDRQMLNEMHDQHIDARKDTQAALLENAESTRANTQAIQSLEQSVTNLIQRKI